VRTLTYGFLLLVLHSTNVHATSTSKMNSTNIVLCMRVAPYIKMASGLMKSVGVSDDVRAKLSDACAKISHAEFEDAEKIITDLQSKKSEFKTTEKLFDRVIELVTAKTENLPKTIETQEEESEKMSEKDGQKILKMLLQCARQHLKSITRTIAANEPSEKNITNKSIFTSYIDSKIVLDTPKTDKTNEIIQINDSKNSTVEIAYTINALCLNDCHGMMTKVSNKILSACEMNAMKDSEIETTRAVKFFSIDKSYNTKVKINKSDDKNFSDEENCIEGLQINFSSAIGLTVEVDGKNMVMPNYLKGNPMPKKDAVDAKDLTMITEPDLCYNPFDFACKA